MTGHPGEGYPAHPVIDGNLDVVDPYGSGQYGKISAAQFLVQGGGPLMPESQSYTQISGTYAPIFSVQGNGGTDTALPFQIVAGAGTYGNSPAILGPVLAMGYNAAAGMSKTPSPHGKTAISFFADAGDTNSGGAHGIELNLSFFTADATGATAAFQLVAVDDNTNTVNTTLRCGTGSSGPYTSNINFTNADATTTFLTMSNATGSSVFRAPVSVTIASGNNNFLLQSTAASSAVVVTLSGNNGSNVNSEIIFAAAGTSQWALNHTPPNLVITDTAHARTAVIFEPGATPQSALFVVNSHLQLLTGASLIMGAAAISTTATDGFIYAPSCAGAPTGLPVTKTGTIPVVIDSTDSKLYAFIGGTWKSTTLA